MNGHIFFFSKRKVQKVTEFVWLICTTDETLFTFQGSGCEKNHISQTHAPCTPLSMVRIMKVLEPLKNCVKTLHGLLQMYRETNIIIENTIIDNINTLRVYFSVKIIRNIVNIQCLPSSSHPVTHERGRHLS